MDPKLVKTMRNIALILTVVTGFSGLVYEVAWHKYLANLLGSQARATAIILAVFLGGLATGYAIFGRWAKNRKPSTLIKCLGWAEIATAIWVFWFHDLYLVVRDGGFVGASSASYSFFTDILYSILLMGLPTILMGGTVPLLTQGFSLNTKDASKFHASVYGINTAGAFLGCVAAGFFLIPSWGLPLTMFIVSTVNAVAGLIFVGLGVRLAEEENEKITEKAKKKAEKNEQVLDGEAEASVTKSELSLAPTRTETSVEEGTASGVATKLGRDGENSQADSESMGVVSLSFGKAVMIVFLTGLYSIALQTVLVRVAGLVMGASEYAFSMIVAVYIAMLAWGAIQLSRSRKVIDQRTLFTNQLVLCLSSVLLYVSIPFFPYLNHVIRTFFSTGIGGFYAYYLFMFFIISLILCVPIGAMGRTLPLVFSSIRFKLEEVAPKIGRLYSINTYGSVVGALLGGYLVLSVIDLDFLFKILIGLMGAVLVLSAPDDKYPVYAKFNGFTPARFVVLLAAVVVFLPFWNREYMGFGTFRARGEVAETYNGREKFHQWLGYGELKYYSDGPNTTVSVFENKLNASENNLDFSRSLVVNGKSDGATSGGDLKTTKLLSHIPALLHSGQTGNAAVVGFGTGLTVESLTLYQEFEAVEVFEISSKVREAASLFDFANGNMTSHPKVKWMVEDAYRVLTHSDKTYDVIVSEPSNPWVTGVEKLFSVDFYGLVKKRLSDGGVYAQWFHIYDSSLPALGMVIKTFSSVFENVRMFRTIGGDIVLIGSPSEIGEEALPNMLERFERKSVKGDFSRIQIQSLAEVLSEEILIHPHAFRDFGMHSLDVPRLSYQAGKDFFMNATVNLNKSMSSEHFLFWNSMIYANQLVTKLYQFHPSERGEIIAAKCGFKKPGNNINETQKAISSAENVPESESSRNSLFGNDVTTWYNRSAPCKQFLMKTQKKEELVGTPSGKKLYETYQWIYGREGHSQKQDLADLYGGELEWANSTLRLVNKDFEWLRFGGDLNKANLWSAIETCAKYFDGRGKNCFLRSSMIVAMVGDSDLSKKYFEASAELQAEKHFNDRLIENLTRIGEEWKYFQEVSKL